MTTTPTEQSFYAAVKVACDVVGIGDQGRSYVEMACLDNADVPSRVWAMATDTLEWYIATDALLAVSRNEV